jgi:hypothetical protein
LLILALTYTFLSIFAEVFLLEKNNIYGYADPICYSKSTLATFVSDCFHEIECKCCTKCCADGDETCNDDSWLANYDPLWVRGYPKEGKYLVLGDDF